MYVVHKTIPRNRACTRNAWYRNVTASTRRRFCANISHLLGQIARCSRLFNRYADKTRCETFDESYWFIDETLKSKKKRKRKSTVGVRGIRNFTRFHDEGTRDIYILLIKQTIPGTIASCVIRRVGITVRIHKPRNIKRRCLSSTMHL